MACGSDEDLARTIQHYGQVAEAVNKREMKRFIEEIRQKWDPLPHEEEYRFEGWTDEGAFTRCVYDQAFYACGRPQHHADGTSVSQAEEEGQVQFHPTLDEIMDYVDKPLAEPLPEGQRIELLNRFNDALQQQLRNSGFTHSSAVKLPTGLEALYSVTDGIQGAGVPTETAETALVNPLPLNSTVGFYDARTMPYEVSIRANSHQKWFGEVPIAALRIGGCEQFRSIFYVLCQPEGGAGITSSPRWRIWDRIDVEVFHYESLTEWLSHETEEIEQREGGSMQVSVLIHDRYPV